VSLNQLKLPAQQKKQLPECRNNIENGEKTFPAIKTRRDSCPESKTNTRIFKKQIILSISGQTPSTDTYNVKKYNKPMKNV
jgi:hypothetical protein